MSFNADAATEQLKAFDVYSPIYKTFKSVDLSVDLIIPKRICSGKRPVIIRFHGGFLITGSSMFLGTFGTWMLAYAQKTQAIVVSPNYRKLPESNGVDLITDLDDFWGWVEQSLEKELEAAANKSIAIDLAKLLVMGQSAGGYLAALSALHPFSFHPIRATILAYPMLDMRSHWFAENYEKHPFGAPMQPASLLTDHLESTKPDTIIGGINPPARMELAISILQQGRFPEFLGNEPEVYPMETLQREKHFPPCFIYHGVEDSAVSAEGTRKWVELLEKVVPDAKVMVKLEHGDHGDSSMKNVPSIEAGWLKEGLDFVEPFWLAREEFRGGLCHKISNPYEASSSVSMVSQPQAKS